MSREIEPLRRSFCRHGSCTFTEVARLVPSGKYEPGSPLSASHQSPTLGLAVCSPSFLSERLAEYGWKPHRIVVAQKGLSRASIDWYMREKQRVRFHRIRDFKQDYFNSIPPTSDSFLSSFFVQEATNGVLHSAKRLRQGTHSAQPISPEGARKNKLLLLLLIIIMLIIVITIIINLLTMIVIIIPACSGIWTDRTRVQHGVLPQAQKKLRSPT